jgi:hypothetical protein
VIGICGVDGCIDTAAVAAIFGALMGFWALGYGVGCAVAWTRRIRDVA